MAQKHTAVQVKDSSGGEIKAVSQESDFPIPPADELAKLHAFRPDLVDVAVDMMKEESVHRRKRVTTIDRNIFVQNLVSCTGAILVALVAFCGSIWLAIEGHDLAAISIVGGTLGTVVYAINRQTK